MAVTGWAPKKGVQKVLGKEGKDELDPRAVKTPFMLSIVSIALNFRITIFKVCMSHHFEIVWT